MKTEFLLNPQFHKDKGAAINIIGNAAKKEQVYLSVSGADQINIGYIEQKDLERFAVNILKALKSKKLKQSAKWKQVPAK